MEQDGFNDHDKQEENDNEFMKREKHILILCQMDLFSFKRHNLKLMSVITIWPSFILVSTAQTRNIGIVNDYFAINFNILVTQNKNEVVL